MGKGFCDCGQRINRNTLESVLETIGDSKTLSEDDMRFIIEEIAENDGYSTCTDPDMDESDDGSGDASDDESDDGSGD